MPTQNPNNIDYTLNPKTKNLIVQAIIAFVVLIILTASSYIVEPGHRGVKITLGKVSPQFITEGFGLKTPFITTILPVSIRQRTAQTQADCYSSDLQQVNVDLRVLYRIPESSVVKIYQEFLGDPFDSLIAPRVNEALKEAAKAKFTQQKAMIEANTAVIKAKGEAEAIKVRGQAIRENPGLIQLQIVEKWNGISPLVVEAGSGSNILLPITNIN